MAETSPQPRRRTVMVGRERVSLSEEGPAGGEAVLLVHGYPLSGLTWRHLTPRLARRFRCIAPDLRGAGESGWDRHTDFSFAAQARMLKDLADHLGLASYRVMAHDTGATIARQLALIDPERVTSMVLIGTEIPGHRPPFIPLLQRLSHPRLAIGLGLLLRSRRFRESRAGFGGCFYDRDLIHGDFYTTHVAPVINDRRRLEGLIRVLHGIDWALVDGLAVRHRDIAAPVLLVWGENDTVFPPARARVMVDQLGDCRGFVVVPRARLFVHEERPDEVATIAMNFFYNPTD